MKLALLLLALAAAGGPAADSREAALAAARAAFARADYAAAESLALAAAQPPQEGAALELAGLARFRAGHADTALAALDAAARAPDAPAPLPLRYNRGACLYELGQFAEAEQEFAAAAADPTLAAAALANAGFAALDAGAPDRARAYEQRAEAAASGAASALVRDLRAQLGNAEAAEAYREGLAAFDEARYVEAREQFLRAVALGPTDPRAQIMAGAAAYKLGRRDEARAALERALDLGPDEADARTAREYLEAAGRSSLAFTGRLLLGFGYDSDALQTGLADPGEYPANTAAAAPSAVASSELSASLHGRLSDSLLGEVAYGFDQLVYLGEAARDRSLQEHGLAASMEWAVTPRFRLGASAGGGVAFTGLSAFRGLQASVGGSAWAALDETARTTTRLGLAFAHKEGLSEFSYLTGNRAESTLAQELRLGLWTLQAGWTLRLEDLGTDSSPTSVPVPRDLCGPSCTEQYVTAFGYLGDGVYLSARAAPVPRLDLAASAGFELRDYLDDSYLQVSPIGVRPVAVDRRRRHDRRFSGSASGSFKVAAPFSLWLRYDLLVNSSNVSTNASDSGTGTCGPPDFDCHRYDAGDHSYAKQVITLGLGVVW